MITTGLYSMRGEPSGERVTTVASEARAAAGIHRPRRLVLDRSIAACFAFAAQLRHHSPAERHN